MNPCCLVLVPLAASVSERAAVRRRYPARLRGIFFCELMPERSTRHQLPQAVESCRQLIKWLIPKIDQFPRKRRFTLGERLESHSLMVLEHLVKAAFSARKTEALESASDKLNVLRHLWRLVYELKAVAHKSYESGRPADAAFGAGGSEVVPRLSQAVDGMDGFLPPNRHRREGSR